MPDYFEALRASVHRWSQETFLVEPHEGADDRAATQTAKIVALQSLYGKEVLPEELMQYFPLHFSFPHVVDGVAHNGQSASAFAELLCAEILVSETHPVITRFWLFSAAVRRMLTTALVTTPARILQVSDLQPAPKQQKRFTLVRAFCADAQQIQQLKAAVLSLRLTQLMLAITAKKRPDTDPMVKQLTTAQVVVRAGNLFAEIVRSFDADPDLDRLLALSSLCTTLLHIAARCSLYASYPYKLWMLCRLHNEASYLDECGRFLEEEPLSLDAGSWAF